MRFWVLEIHIDPIELVRAAQLGAGCRESSHLVVITDDGAEIGSRFVTGTSNGNLNSESWVSALHYRNLSEVALEAGVKLGRAKRGLKGLLNVTPFVSKGDVSVRRDLNKK